MKKFLAVVALLAMALTLSACKKDPASDFEYEDFNGGVYIRGYKGTDADVVIPQTLDGKTVKYIWGGFKDNAKIKSVTVPEGVNHIMESTFENCDSLESVKLPGSLNAISQKMFKSCMNLKSIEIPEGVAFIQDHAFENCINLTDISFPTSITEVGRDAFIGTAWLENKRAEDPLIIVNNIVIEGQGCTGDVVIPNGVTTINPAAFAYCDGPDSVQLPDTVTEICLEAFSGCRNLNKINIPDSVTYLAQDAFYSCENISLIYKGETYSYEELEEFYKLFNENNPPA